MKENGRIKHIFDWRLRSSVKTLNLFIIRYGLTEHGASGCKLSGIISIHTSVFHPKEHW